MAIVLCPNCMEMAMPETGICSSCGYNVNAPKMIKHSLAVGTALHNRYMVGKILGEGGFGITYLGFDTKHSEKIAIKEYYPSSFVRRDNSTSSPVKNVTVLNNASAERFFKYGKDKFIHEAQSLARFSQYPGIVSIHDLFTENNTAYIVMEFLNGKTLKQILKERQTLTEPEILALVKPIVKSLAAMHDANIMHRDIAPDNIIVMQDNAAKLIDFGSTAEQTGGASQATVALVKHGFAPEEQYSANRAGQGSWTDVYALCATIYRALTGYVPISAEERLRGRVLAPLGANVSAKTASTLTRGLALYAKDRTQNMYQLYFQLYGESIVRASEYSPETVFHPQEYTYITSAHTSYLAPSPSNAAQTSYLASSPSQSNAAQTSYLAPSPSPQNAAQTSYLAPSPSPQNAAQTSYLAPSTPSVAPPPAPVPPGQYPSSPVQNTDNGLLNTIGTPFFVLMIVGLVFSFFPIITYVCSVISLVRCIIKRKLGETTVGIVINAIALAVALALSISSVT